MLNWKWFDWAVVTTSESDILAAWGVESIYSW
jgi:hypothetical protein